ncbi:MAG: hypothetical protein JWQ74_2876 [Marmoricola sp.]|nr:hypothetical protein [Marmoricola sp.]
MAVELAESGHGDAMTKTPGSAPEPTIDENPDPGNEVGGADAVDEDFSSPPVGREVPVEHQVTHEAVPDELLQPEGPDREADIDDPSSEPSA